MQYNRNGSIGMVMRRNVIAEIHRGSVDLLPQTRLKRPRDDFTVINAVPGSLGLYRQFLHASTGIWVHCGDAIQYRDDSSDSDIAIVARIDFIRRAANGILTLGVMKFNRVTNSVVNVRPLENVAEKWILETDERLRLTIQPIEDDLALTPFPLQPDFGNHGTVFFSCPWMRIVLWMNKRPIFHPTITNSTVRFLNTNHNTS